MRITNNWLPVLTRADADTPHISVAETKITNPDLSGSSWYRRIRWRARYKIFKRGYDELLSTRKTQRKTHSGRQAWRKMRERRGRNRQRPGGRRHGCRCRPRPSC